MIKLTAVATTYQLPSTNAIINNNDITPGQNGCQINIEKSYLKMKKVGSYQPKLLYYEELKPKISLSNTYDKYIISGNLTNKEVAIIFKVTYPHHLNDLNTILKEKGILASFFIDGKELETNPQYYYPLINTGHELYNSGYDNNYNKEMLIWTNNLINSISNNHSSYCLTLTEDDNILKLCQAEKMHTLKPNIIINYSNPFTLVKSKIEKGSLILFELNSLTKHEVIGLINFLTQKGYHFKLLSEHLNEKGC